MEGKGMNSSMLYWWPKVKDLSIPMPKTEIIEIDMGSSHVLDVLDGDEEAAKKLDGHIPEILATISRVGLPAFLRTDDRVCPGSEPGSRWILERGFLQS